MVYFCWEQPPKMKDWSEEDDGVIKRERVRREIKIAEINVRDMAGNV